jgi:hypothetical protein
VVVDASARGEPLLQTITTPYVERFTKQAASKGCKDCLASAEHTTIS